LVARNLDKFLLSRAAHPIKFCSDKGSSFKTGSIKDPHSLQIFY